MVNYPSDFYKKISIPEYSLQASASPLQTVVTPISPQSLQSTNLTSQPGHITKQVTDQLFNHVLNPSAIFPLFDDSQVGELLGFEISTDNPNVILQIYYYADNPTVFNYINNWQMHELLSLGRGLTPGDVTVLPNLQTQDITGRPSAVFPYLARFKFDSVPDFASQFNTNVIFGALPNVIVLKHEPAVPNAYKRIVANIINQDDENNATIISLDIKRIIHDILAPSEITPQEPTVYKGPGIRRTTQIPSSPEYNSYLKKKSQEPELYES